MRMRIALYGVALLAVLLIGARPASAQNPWCYDVCYPYTECDTECYNGGWLTCGQWGWCDYHSCSWSSICNSNVECITECYDGPWPNGSWTTCGDAEQPCFTCEPDYHWDWYEVGRWNEVEYPYAPYDWTPVCKGYRTRQYKAYDQNECISYDRWLYGECDIDLLTGPRYNDNYCCDDMVSCWGEVWPSSCT